MHFPALFGLQSWILFTTAKLLSCLSLDYFEVHNINCIIVYMEKKRRMYCYTAVFYLAESACIVQKINFVYWVKHRSRTFLRLVCQTENFDRSLRKCQRDTLGKRLKYAESGKQLMQQCRICKGKFECYGDGKGSIHTIEIDFHEDGQRNLEELISDLWKELSALT